MTDREKQNREELFKLIQENPDLPIVPMVDYEIIAEDYGRWLGTWGSSYIGEYLIGEERIYFRDEDDASEVDRVCEEWLDDAYETMSDKEAKEAYIALPWIKAIIVDIDLPG